MTSQNTRLGAYMIEQGSHGVGSRVKTISEEFQGQKKFEKHQYIY